MRCSQWHSSITQRSEPSLVQFDGVTVAMTSARLADQVFAIIGDVTVTFSRRHGSKSGEAKDFDI
jgi:hypothetical protein